MSTGVRRRRFCVFRAFGNSPLVRRFDRIEAVATVLAVALLVVAVPVGALAGRVNVANRLLNVARQVDVQWSSPFQQREDSLSTTEPVRVGDRITVWLGKAGELAEPPKTVRETQTAAIGTGLAVWAGTALVCLIAMTALRFSLNRRRYA